MIIEFQNGNQIDVFPCVAISYDVKDGATWFGEDDQREAYDFSYNYEGNDLLGMLEEMESRGCKNIECYCELTDLHDKVGVTFYYTGRGLSIDADDETYMFKQLAKELTDGLDMDVDDVANKLMYLNSSVGIPFNELANLCWQNIATVFDMINMD